MGEQTSSLNHLALGFLEWLWQHWIDGKVKLTMTDVDKQAEEIVKSWEGEDGEQWDVVEEGVFGDEGWSIRATALTEGPKKLLDAWALQAMLYDYKETFKRYQK